MIELWFIICICYIYLLFYFYVRIQNNNILKLIKFNFHIFRPTTTCVVSVVRLAKTSHAKQSATITIASSLRIPTNLRLYQATITNQSVALCQILNWNSYSWYFKFVLACWAKSQFIENYLPPRWFNRQFVLFLILYW